MKIKFVTTLIFIATVFPVAIFAAPVLRKPIAKVPIVAVTSKHPLRIDPIEIELKINARAYVVLDRTTGKILTEKQENLVWPIASLTKLMTTELVLNAHPSLRKTQSVLGDDDVGGAKLYVKSGDAFTVDDLFYAAFLGSANNAANALSRLVAPKEVFVAKMNARAKQLGLSNTHYADPTGMEVDNTSTVLNIAWLADREFARQEVMRYATTPVRTILVANTGEQKKIKNADWMLSRPEYDDMYVTGGKTGYLEESGWNFVSAIRPSAAGKKQELLIVVFGDASRDAVFKDTQSLANWAWNVYAWK